MHYATYVNVSSWRTRAKFLQTNSLVYFIRKTKIHRFISSLKMLDIVKIF